MQFEYAARLDAFSRQVDEALDLLLRGQPDPVPRLHEGALYALGLDQDDPAQRGKRLRPALCLLACEALEGDPGEALPYAVAVELMHNFFLVHDDIEDGDAYRRGRPSVWKRYGVDHAINIGDFLFNALWGSLLGGERGGPPALRLELAAYLSRVVEQTIAGQALEMNARDSREVDTAAYLEIVGKKTAQYLTAPILCGARVAGCDAACAGALEAFGARVGPVFQVVDDLIDLTEGKGREAVGSDIREGKRSYLVAHSAARGSAEERERLYDILDLPREETGEAEVAWARDFFERQGAFEAARAFCRRMMDEAHRELEAAPPQLARPLGEIFEALIERKR